MIITENTIFLSKKMYVLNYNIIDKFYINVIIWYNKNIF